jgi:repressor LexA
MGRKQLLEVSQILDAIERTMRETGLPPTIRELARKLGGVSTRTIHRYLEKIEAEGLIERWRGSRGIRLLRSANPHVQTVAVPLVGEAPAGPLMLAEENREGWLRLPKSFLRPPTAPYYLLRVRGDSMNKAKVEGGRIEDGDLVLVRQQPTAVERDVVVALIDGEATIKRLTRGPSYVVLKPESMNPTHRPILATRTLMVQGVVKRVLKRGSTLID